MTKENVGKAAGFVASNSKAIGGFIASNSKAIGNAAMNQYKQN
jgi:hypothetical protein